MAYNIMFIASVSTVLFNGNPLLRFDGYYILSDLLDIPNLYTRAVSHLRHVVDRYAFGYKESFSPTRSFKEAFWLGVFGVLSRIYRVVVFSGVIFFVADKFLLAGLVMALICVVSWGLVPVFRLIKYLTDSPRLARTRVRAAAVCVGFFVLVVSFLALFPFPNRFRAPGVIETTHYVRVVNDAPGYVRNISAPSGREVRPGTPLIELSDLALGDRVEGGLLVELQAGLADLAGQGRADLLFDVLEGDVDVVAVLGLGRRREDGFGQLVGLPEALGDLEAEILPVVLYSFQPEPDR